MVLKYIQILSISHFVCCFSSKTISSKLTNITDQAVEPFKTIFSTSDIPVEHPVLRVSLEKIRTTDPP